VQWGPRKDGTVGWLTLYAQATDLVAVAGERTLNLTYPTGNETSTFQFLIGTNSRYGKRDVSSWEDVEGVRVTVSGTVDQNYAVTFNGLHGGAGDVIK
jgi:hypothetical protein